MSLEALRAFSLNIDPQYVQRCNDNARHLYLPAGKSKRAATPDRVRTRVLGAGEFVEKAIDHAVFKANLTRALTE